MPILTARVEQARITITIDFKPCPFCGGENLKVITVSGETFDDVDFIDCGDCLATVAADVWNKAPRTNPPRRIKPYRKPLP